MRKRLIFLAILFASLPAALRPALVETELSYNPRNAKGVYPFVSYLGGQGMINLVNGNLIFSRQLVTRSGRAGFDLDLRLVYNSKIWDRTGSVMAVMEPGSWTGLGWRLEFPKLVQGASSYAIVFPDGSSHEIADYGGGVWKSVDSSYIRLDPATKTATLPGGVKLAFGNTVGSTTYLTEMKDRNGNQIKATYVAGTGKLSRVEDTLGTAAIFYYDAQGYLQRVLSLGATKTRIDFTYQSKYLNPSFSIPTQAATEKVLTSATVFLPLKDLRQSYDYDGYGALMRVTDTVIDYAYDSGQPYCRGQEIGRRDDILVAYQYQTVRFRDQLYGFVEERVAVNKSEYVVNSGNTQAHSWQISYSVDQTKSNPSSVYVTDEKGRSDYDLFHTVNGRSWSDGLLQRVRRRTSPYANPPLQLLRTEETAWTQDNTAVGYIVNPRVTSRTSTLETGQSAHSDFVYTDDGTGNVREVKEYGFDGSLMRRTVTYYWHESHTGYDGANLTNLPSSVQVLDGSGVEASRTEHVYDAGALTGYGGSILNHDPAFGTSFVMRGNATSTGRYLQEAGRYVTSTAAYDIAGNVVSNTDARGNSVSFAYSAACHYAVRQSVTNALGHVTQYTWSRRPIYEESGQLAGYGPVELASVKDPNNVTVASYAYDYYLSRVTQEQTPAETRNYGYDDFAYLTTASSSSGYRYTTGNPTGESVRQEQSDPQGENIVQTADYDLFHRIQSRSLPYRKGGGAPSQTYVYDALGRMTLASTPPAGSVAYQYTGNTVLATDADGRRQKYTYDALGRMVKVTVEDSQGSLNVETTYEYDALDWLHRIVDGNQVRLFVYDSLGRLVSETHPESGTTAYGYDDNANLTSSTDARGLATTHSYDALDRMTATGYSDATPGSSFSYDETSSSLIGAITNGKGRRTSAWTADGTGYSWSYNTAGRVLDQVFKIDATTYPVHYSYMDGGCGCTRKDLMSMTYPGAFEVNYTRDSIGRLLSISRPNPVYDHDWYLRDVDYEAADGAVSMLRFGNNVRDYFYYYSNGRLSDLKLRYSSTFSVSWMYQYHPSGRISRIDELKLNPDNSR